MFLNANNTIGYSISLCTIILPFPIRPKLEELDSFPEPGDNEDYKICEPLHDPPTLISFDRRF